MVRHTFWAVLACPLLLALACGDDDDSPFNGGTGGSGKGDGGAQSDGGTAGSDTGGTAGSPQGGASGGIGPEGGQAGAPTTGGATNGGSGGTTSGGSGGSGGITSGGSGGTTSGGSGGSPPEGGSTQTGGTAGADGGTPSTGGIGGAEGGAGAGGGGEQPLILTVTTNANVVAISPLIYGVLPSSSVACSNAKGNFALCKLGGNLWSTYNWENNAANAGADSGGCSRNTNALGASGTAGQTVTALIDEANGISATSVVTIPMLDYVAADKDDSDACSNNDGDNTNDGIQLLANYRTTRLRANQPRKGADPVYPPSTSDSTVSQDEFINHLLVTRPTSNLLFTLDNQPELWDQTHVALHNNAVTYAEVIDRSVDYAPMIKDNWPGAEVTGPGGYGWLAFTDLQDAPRVNGAEFLDYYLSEMNQASTTAGRRLLDYLDVHWYSVVAAGGLIAVDVPNDPTPGLAAARVQAPRSLFEAGYAEPSWIGDQNGPIRLIPWLKQKIADFYPGTKLAISGWSYGGGAAISGAIAVADVLGIFGREGVDMAALEPQGNNNSFAIGGMSIYRNFDGAGATFGDRSVRAVSTDPTNVTVYASTDSGSPGRVVIVAINKSTQPLTAALEVQDSHTFTAANVHVLTSANAAPQAATALTATSANHFETTLPAFSVSVIVPHD